MWFTLALKHWKLLALALLLIAFGLWLRSYGNNRCEECRAAVVATYEKKLSEANERVRIAEIEARKRVEVVDREYQEKLQDLDAKYRDASRRLGSIRVRQCPSGSSALSRDPDPASGYHGPANGDGLSREISGDIERLLRAADEQTQRLVACQAFIATLH